MSPPITYLQFLALFVVPPVVALAVTTPRPFAGRGRVAGVGVGVLAAIALGYTTPWDNHLIARGVWWYGDGAVERRLWYAPVCEYLFVLLQSLLTGLWVARLSSSRDDSDPVRGSFAGAAAWMVVALSGVALLGVDGGYYLGAILAWAAPVLALQVAYGGRYLWRCRRRCAVAVLVPTLYLATVDRVAIAAGVWQLSPSQTTGLTVLGLPVEEGLFFLLTNLLLVQGLVLYFRVTDDWRRTGAVRWR